MKLIFDLEWKVKEGERIVEDAVKIWVACFKEHHKDNWFIFDENNIEEMKVWLESLDNPTLVGHNILGADLEVMRRLQGIEYTVGADTICGKPCDFIDTLVLSRGWNPDIEYNAGGKHGLFAWAVRLNGVKPVVEDWEGLDLETYLHRCKSDVILTEQVLDYLEERNDI